MRVRFRLAPLLAFVALSMCVIAGPLDKAQSMGKSSCRACYR